MTMYFITFIGCCVNNILWTAVLSGGNMNHYLLLKMNN